MVDFLAGLLGGMAGTGEAVKEIADDKLHSLAEHLKMKAMEEIQMRSDDRRFGHDRQIQGESQEFESAQNKERRDFEKGLLDTEIASKEKLSAAGIASDEKIAGERNALSVKLGEIENGLRQQQLQVDKDSNEARIIQAKLKALEESRKASENYGSIDEINAPLEAAGLPLMEEYEMAPGKDGLFSDTPPVMGLRRKGAGAPPAPPANAPKVGTVDGGYKFKGGDPADPKNWEKI